MRNIIDAFGEFSTPAERIAYAHGVARGLDAAIQYIKDNAEQIHLISISDACRTEFLKVISPPPVSRMTVGDCVIILGKPWASENGIRTAEDLCRPAPPEWAELARRTYAAQQSIKEGKEIVAAAEKKHGGRR